VGGIVLALVLAVLAPTAAAAAGATFQLTVVNSLGTPLFSTFVKSGGLPIAITDGGGVASLEVGTAVSGGEVLEVANYASAGPPPASPCSAVPESVIYTVPEPPPTAATVTIPAQPSSLDPSFEPGLSDPELKFLGLMNELRRSLGVAPLQASSTLDAVADRYLSRIRTVSIGEEPHCQAGSPFSRMVDGGFPTSNGGENLAYNGMCSAEGTFGAFLSEKGKPEDGHYLNMIDPEHTMVGIATDGSSWVTDFGDLPASSPFLARAGPTGQFGDPSLPDAECEASLPTTQPVASPARHRRPSRPDLYIARTRLHGPVLELAVGLRSHPDGRLHAEARRLRPSGARRTFALVNHGGLSHGTVRLTAGRWRIAVRFVSADPQEWRAAEARRRITVRQPDRRPSGRDRRPLG
jgi:uncharacterized protein YkwD